MRGVSLDAQGLFPFDGIDDYDTFPLDDNEDPDDELYNEGKWLILCLVSIQK